MTDSKSKVEERLRKYLERDKVGIRRSLLRLFLKGGKFTTAEIYNRLNYYSDLNIRGTSAMVGLMSSRLGILKVELGEKNRYFIRPEYVDLVESILREFEGD